ncbi:hypothetical protein [Cellulosimicrobium funkei]|uniref:hypothetical protein n=1 Tax=Cellulosimicrobium funkei TaxID=264251 RepID=UPI0030FCC6CB
MRPEACQTTGVRNVPWGVVASDQNGCIIVHTVSHPDPETKRSTHQVLLRLDNPRASTESKGVEVTPELLKTEDVVALVDESYWSPETGLGLRPETSLFEEVQQWGPLWEEETGRKAVLAWERAIAYYEVLQAWNEMQIPHIRSEESAAWAMPEWMDILEEIDEWCRALAEELQQIRAEASHSGVPS